MPTPYEAERAEAYRSDPKAIMGRLSKQDPGNLLVEAAEAGIGITEATEELLVQYLGMQTPRTQGRAAVLVNEQDLVKAQKYQLTADAKRYVKDSKEGPIDFASLRLGPDKVAKAEARLSESRRLLKAVETGTKDTARRLLAQHATGETVARISDDYAALQTPDEELQDMTHRQVLELQKVQANGRPLLFNLYKLALAPSQVTPREMKRLTELWSMAPEVMPRIEEVRTEFASEIEELPAARYEREREEAKVKAKVDNAAAAAAMAASRINRSDATVTK
jgi:hypothetical protein